MQPTSGSPQYPTQAGYGAPNVPIGRPGFAPVAPQETVGLVRVRAWLVGIVAGLTMLVLIAGIANQGVTDQIVKHVTNQKSFFDLAVYSVTAYSWRFSPQFSSDIGHIWIGGIIFDLIVVVLTLLLTAALAKHKKGFGGAFLSAWVAVFVATQISAYVRASIVNVEEIQDPTLSKAAVVFFGKYSPGLFSLFASLVFGLVTALIVGAVATATRRTEILAAPAPVYPPAQQPEEPQQRREPQQAQAWAAPPPPGPISSSSPSPWTQSRVDTTKRDEPQPTAVLPAVDEPRRENTTDSQATTQFPAWPPRDERRVEGEPTPEPGSKSESESTQAYRVPIDGDEPDRNEATQAYRLPHDDDNEQQPRREP